MERGTTDPHSQAGAAPASSATPPPVDAAQLSYLRQRLESEQNLVLGVAAGAVASLAGAGMWAALTVVSGYQIGFMAIGVGFLVGYAIRAAGKGVTSPFGVAGGALALLGCGLGNLLAVTAIVAQNDGVALLDALPQLTPGIAQQLMVAFFSPMDVLFYGLAAWEGYRLSFRQLRPGEAEGILTGAGG